jgi:hypothetical protein
MTSAARAEARAMMSRMTEKTGDAISFFALSQQVYEALEPLKLPSGDWRDAWTVLRGDPCIKFCVAAVSVFFDGTSWNLCVTKGAPDVAYVHATGLSQSEGEVEDFCCFCLEAGMHRDMRPHSLPGTYY